jgi:hypothetical protein
LDAICFSGPQLVFLGTIWAVIQGVIVFLFRGWLGSLRDEIASCKDSIKEARAERDRMADGWEQTIGLGETVVKRERRRAP